MLKKKISRTEPEFSEPKPKIPICKNFILVDSKKFHPLLMKKLGTETLKTKTIKQKARKRC